MIGDLGYATGGPIVKISEVLEDGRLRVSMDSQGMQSRVVYRGENLLNEDAESRLRSAHGAELQGGAGAFRRQRDAGLLPGRGAGPALEQDRRPGRGDRRHQGRHRTAAAAPGAVRAVRQAPAKGILLFGPPGCGKTLIGKATAYNLTQEYRERTGKDVKEYFMYINGPKILNMWLGESERRCARSLRRRVRSPKRAIWSSSSSMRPKSLLRTRSSGRLLNISNTIVPQFCAEMDGLVSLENVVVMLTSNRPDYIDPAILRPERIDRKVKVVRPDRRSTRDIYKIYLSRRAARSRSDPRAQGRLHRRAGRTAGSDRRSTRSAASRRRSSWKSSCATAAREILYWKDLVSGALIKSVVERAKDFAIKRSIEKRSDDEGLRAWTTCSRPCASSSRRTRSSRRATRWKTG